MGSKLSLTSVFTTICSFMMSIICLLLAVNSMLHLKNVVEVGSFIITDHMEVRSEPSQSNNWETFNFSIENRSYIPTYYYPQYVNLNINFSSVKPNCSNCSKTNATFVGSNTCYYFTTVKHTFKECFTACVNISNCYFFFGNFNNMSLVRSHINKTKTYWVGAYRDVSDTYWRDLNKSQVDVYDVYQSTCAFISRYTPVPRSAFDCNYKRFCVCGGYF
ncbi:ORF51 [Felid gammaherpesvirus 1]|uniref:ORF51 n=1 Tax=Felid gammaherpesvirus 1 TaxID=2560468 RepID=A0A0M5KZI9_9GAMA|nr:ORF51 [Felis catus gammaherpesvirus 1]ALE14764.1 ORF51 [Felis catus gammaherpesvirus 1]